MNGASIWIGVPAFNAERYIGACLESISAQTCGDFRVVIGDNASTDGTADICRDHVARDARFSYVQNERNVGIHPNYNRLFAHCEGDYWKWIASDDRMDPRFLETCAAVLAADPGVAIATGQIRLIGDDGQALRWDERRQAYVASDGGTVPAPRDFGARLSSGSAVRRFRAAVVDLREPNLAACVYGLHRASVLRRTGGLGPYVGADKVLISTVALLGRIEQAPVDLLEWRIHPGQSGRTRPVEATRRIDTSWDGRRTWMYPRQIRGYVRAIRVAGVGPLTAAECAAVVIEKLGRGVVEAVRPSDPQRRLGAGDPV